MYKNELLYFPKYQKKYKKNIRNMQKMPTYCYIRYFIYLNSQI